MPTRTKICRSSSFPVYSRKEGPCLECGTLTTTWIRGRNAMSPGYRQKRHCTASSTKRHRGLRLRSCPESLVNVRLTEHERLLGPLRKIGRPDPYGRLRVLQICLSADVRTGPAWYFTASELTWDAMLKKARVELQLFEGLRHGPDLKRGVRGSVSQCCRRYATANKKLVKEYDRTGVQLPGVSRQ